MTTDALIGHTGYVGGTLARQREFQARFNSANVDALPGQAFDTVVCAAAPGSMLTANRQPEADRAQIDSLIARLDGVRARRFVLISSIAVLEDFAGGQDEGTGAFQQTLAYGRHRRLLEAFCESRFERCLIVRLPALFGPGLRKNFLFDLLNPVPQFLAADGFDAIVAALPPDLRAALPGLYGPDPASGLLRVNRAALDADPRKPALAAALLHMGMAARRFHNPQTTYQYYDMSRLWADIERADRAGLSCIHLATAPLAAATIHRRLLGTEMPDSGARLHREDMRTRHADLWGRSGPYLQDATEVLDALAAFFAAEVRAR